MSDPRGVLLDRMISEINDLRRRVEALETGEYVARAGDADTLDGLHADATGAADAHVVATDANGDATVVDLTVSGGLNLGTATGAGTGDIHASGRIGVGTSDPQGALHVKAADGETWSGFLFAPQNYDSAAPHVLTAPYAGGFLLSGGQAPGQSSGKSEIHLASPGILLLTGPGSSAATEKMRLTNAGRVLIGTTTDDGVNLLQVNGSALMGAWMAADRALVREIAAPSAIAGWIQIFGDSADGDLKVRFPNGTIKTIQTN